MKEFEGFIAASRRFGLMLDANVLTLLIVGSVNRARIARFKRTQRYDESSFELLLRLLELASPARLLALPHVLTEVSNLTDLEGRERLAARVALQMQIRKSDELSIDSRTASDHAVYLRLGLTDAAIACSATEHKFAVLTDDLDLYVALLQKQTVVMNFTHLRQLQMES